MVRQRPVVMLEPTLREGVEDAGVREIYIKEDGRGMRATGEFKGTVSQLERRLDSDLELEDYLSVSGEPLQVTIRPRV
jgi:hypothetical protein